MIRYKKYQVTGEDSPLKGLWYARPVIEETFDIEKLAKHMSNHNTPYSSGVIKGVLADMVSCTKELILDGKHRIGEICYLVGINSPSYFSKIFLKQFGVTPKDFEKQNQAS